MPPASYMGVGGLFFYDGENLHYNIHYIFLDPCVYYSLIICPFDGNIRLPSERGMNYENQNLSDQHGQGHKQDCILRT